MCSFDFEVNKQPRAYIYRNWSFYTDPYKFHEYTDNTSLDQSITPLRLKATMWQKVDYHVS